MFLQISLVAARLVSSSILFLLAASAAVAVFYCNPKCGCGCGCGLTFDFENQLLLRLRPFSKSYAYGSVFGCGRPNMIDDAVCG